MSIIDSRNFIEDLKFRPFEYDFRHDLLSANTPTEGVGRFIVAKLKPPKGMVYVVKGMAFYAMERLNVGLPEEDFRLISPAVANGYFAFEPKVSSGSPFLLGMDYNSLVVAASAQDRDRTRAKSITYLSSDPREDALNGMYRQAWSVLIPSQAEFTVVFSILPAGAVGPVTNLYAVGGGAGGKRVDFAGAYLIGVSATAQDYEDEFEKVKT